MTNATRASWLRQALQGFSVPVTTPDFNEFLARIEAATAMPRDFASKRGPSGPAKPRLAPRFSGRRRLLSRLSPARPAE